MTIEEAIASLPSNPDDIACFLEVRGITGERDEPTACPLAQFFRHEVPDVTARVQLYVQEELKGGEFEVYGVHGAYPLPSAANLFVKAFDSGEYPQLDQDATEEEKQL